MSAMRRAAIAAALVHRSERDRRYHPIPMRNAYGEWALRMACAREPRMGFEDPKHGGNSQTLHRAAAKGTPAALWKFGPFPGTRIAHEWEGAAAAHAIPCSYGPKKDVDLSQAR